MGDFGSARSATDEGYHWAEQDPPERARAAHFADATQARRQAQNLRVRTPPGLRGCRDLRAMRPRMERQTSTRGVKADDCQQSARATFGVKKHVALPARA